MDKKYTKTNWENGKTRLNATNMNHIEDGIETLYNEALDENSLIPGNSAKIDKVGDKLRIGIDMAEVTEHLQASGYVEDPEYTHTDNNYTDAEKQSLEDLGTDVTALNTEQGIINLGPEIYDLSSAISLVPEDKRKPGIIIQYKSENGWELRQFIGDDVEEDWDNTENWDIVGENTEIDNTPTEDSPNAVSSGGVYEALSGKQNVLVSGTDIKTLNNESLLGSGNISIEIPTTTSDLINDSDFATTSDVSNAVSGKQNEITAQNKLNADLVDDSTSSNKFVTATEKVGAGKGNTAIQGVILNGTELVPDSNKKVSITSVDGASAYEIAVENGYSGTEQEWLDSLHASIGEFMFVANDPTAEAALTTYGSTYTSAISGVSPSSDTLSTILLMNDDDTTPTKTMMIATEDDGNSGYQFVYVGDLSTAMSANIDDIPTPLSENLVRSGGVNKYMGIYNFKFSFTQTPSTYTYRTTPFNFQANHRYSIFVLTPDANDTTYFSLYNGSDRILNALISNSGIRNGSFLCPSVCDEFRMVTQTGVTNDITYDVLLVDEECFSFANLFRPTDKIYSFRGAGGTIINFNIYNLLPNRKYAIIFSNSSLFFSGTSNYIAIYTSETASTAFYTSSKIYDNPLYFTSPAEPFDYLNFRLRADSGVNVKFIIVDVTEIINLCAHTKYTKFVLGRAQSLTTWGQSRSYVSLKRGTYVHLNVGDVVGLTNYTDAKFGLFNASGIYGVWQTEDFVVDAEGDYQIAVTNSTPTEQTDETALASLFKLKTREQIGAEKGELCNNILEISNHDDVRDFTFAHKGGEYNINGVWHENADSAWYLTDKIHLYRGETIAFTGKGSSISSPTPLIILTDSTDSFHTSVASAYNVNTAVSYYANTDCYVILQSRYTPAVSPSIYGSSIALHEIEDEIKAIRAEITLPDYTLDEIDRVYRYLIGKANASAAIIAFNTDQHVSPVSYGVSGDSSNPIYALHGIKSIVKIARKLPIDLVVLGGDAAGYDFSNGGYSGTIDGIIDEINLVNEPLSEINTPCISIPGNHDASTNNSYVTSECMYNVNYKRSKWIKGIVHSGTDNCNSYFDDNDKKIRYIFLDTWSKNNNASPSAETVATYVSSVLNTMGSDYKAVIFSHNALSNEFSDIKKYDGSNIPSNAFADPKDIHSTLDNYASSIIACICGHAHTDGYAVSNSGILYIETTSAVRSRYRFEGTPTIPYLSILGSAKETSFDFYVINTVDETIEAVRFGQGTNRKFKYGQNAGWLSYKNCVSGESSVPSVTLVFTNSSDNEDVVSAKCDSKGKYEIYLSLGQTYNITCSDYTLDVNQVTVSENTNLNLTLTE